MNTLRLNGIWLSRYKMWHWRLISVFILAVHLMLLTLPCKFQAGCRTTGNCTALNSCFQWFWAMPSLQKCVCLCVWVSCMQVGIDVMCLVMGNFRQFVVWCWIVLSYRDDSMCFVIGIQKVYCVCLCHEVYLPSSLILNQHRNTLLKAASLLSRWKWSTSQLPFFCYVSMGLVISVAAVL